MDVPDGVRSFVPVIHFAHSDDDNSRCDDEKIRREHDEGHEIERVFKGDELWLVVN